MTASSTQQTRVEPEQRRQFWARYSGLVWSNAAASDAIYIRAALLRPRFDMLLDIALEFGLDRLRTEWQALAAEGERETLRAAHSTERILGNISKGFARAQA